MFGLSRACAETIGIHRPISQGLFGRPVAPEEGVEVAPQSAPFLTFGRGQFVQSVGIAQPGETGIFSPPRQCFPGLGAILRGTAVQAPGPGVQVSPEPLTGLGAPARPLRADQFGPVLPEATACEG